MQTISTTYIKTAFLRPFAAFLILICAAIGASIPASAETVSQKEAKKKAQLFFNQAYKETVAPVKLVYNGKRLTTGRFFSPFYVYNQQRGGFVIISAENKTFPILGYSLKGTFDPDRLSDGEKGWLKNYALDIEMIRLDSRVPEEAIKAWQNYPQYVADLLAAPYDATDPSIAIEESEETIDRILTLPDDSEDGKYSAYYTPGQWNDMIAEELSKTGSLAIGYVDYSKKLFPGVIHGRKGDYYRIEFDRRNDWLLRLSAAEYFGERFVAAVGNPRYVAEPEPEEQPFAYYDEILEERRREAAEAESRLREELTKPIVRAVGNGRFDILFPEPVALAMLYNISGSHIGRATYKDTSTAHIDLEAEPHGIYFALVVAESGKPYGLKLYR